MNGPRKWERLLLGWELPTLIVLALLPYVLGNTLGPRISDLFIFAILALGLHVVVGYTGLLHLGIAAFFAIGAYTAGVLMVVSFPFQVGLTTALIAAAAAAAFCGLILGAPTLRLRGDYLALVTLGFGEVVIVALKNLEAITAGTTSLGPLRPPTMPAWLASIISMLRLSPDFTPRNFQMFYYVSLGVLVLTVLLLRNLECSRLGRAWVALREDELAASCMAINTTRVKLAAFALGAALAGIAGCLYAAKLTNTADPEKYGFNVSITVLCCLILGGLGSIRGTLLGVLLLKGYEFILAPLLDSWTQGFRDGVVGWLSGRYPGHSAAIDKVNYLLTFSNWKLMTFGLVLILMIRFRPEGLLPSRRVKHEIEGTGE